MLQKRHLLKISLNHLFKFAYRLDALFYWDQIRMPENAVAIKYSVSLEGDCTDFRIFSSIVGHSACHNGFNWTQSHTVQVSIAHF
jgi:hypothetical protein